MSIDLKAARESSSKDEQGTLVHIEHRGGVLAYFTPDGSTEHRPVTIRLAGKYSAAYKAAERDIMKQASRARKNRLSPEQIEANRTKLVAVCILEWEGFTDDGRPYPCTPKNAIDLLQAAPWIRNQLEEELGDETGFSETSSTT